MLLICFYACTFCFGSLGFGDYLTFLIFIKCSFRLQYAELEDIVEKIITNMLGHKFSSLPNDDLVEMESRVKN